jgi:hypothetical protein
VETSLKNEIKVTSIVPIFVSSSLKNEIYFFPSLFESSTSLRIVFEASFHPPMLLDEPNLGGQCFQPLVFMMKVSR